MSRYKDQDLFGSGPHEFHMHGLSQRHASHEQPGADGARLTTLGFGARKIEATGTLLADYAVEMNQQVDVIEAAMDDQPGTLIDDQDRQFDDVVLIAFRPEIVRRAGVRLSLEYQADFMQVQT